MRFFSLSIAIFLLLMGCVSHTNSLVGASRSIKPVEKKQAPARSVKSIAILPIAGLEGSEEIYAQTNRIVAEFRNRNPALEVHYVDYNENTLNDVQRRSLFQAAHATDMAVVKQDLHSVYNTDAVFYGRIMSFEARDGKFALWPGTAQVLIEYRIVDLRDGTILWQKSVQGVKESLTTLEKAPNVDAAIKDANNLLAKQVPMLAEVSP